MNDYLVVGAGFAGATVARQLADAGHWVTIIDRRPHVAGNAYDYYDHAGVLVHLYGPHAFHTNSLEVFNFLSRFTSWRKYEHRVLAEVKGKLLPIPINLNTVNRLYGWKLTPDELTAYFAKVAEPRAEIRTSEDVVVSKVGRELYELFFKNYTRKQWGKDPSELSSTVAGRLPVRTTADDRYFTDTWQAMPEQGYTALLRRMLDHPYIRVQLGCDYRDCTPTGEVVYTGQIDEFFDYKLGKLPYRSLRFQFHTHLVAEWQPVAVINYPNQHAFTRVTEFKHLTGQKLSKTTIAYEYPSPYGDPYYPVPCPESAALYREYLTLAARVPWVHFTGRLGSYQYLNIDQVVAQSLALVRRMTTQEATC